MVSSRSVTTHLTGVLGLSEALLIESGWAMLTLQPASGC
jgi:hypothetical protein